MLRLHLLDVGPCDGPVLGVFPPSPCTLFGLRHNYGETLAFLKMMNLFRNHSSFILCGRFWPPPLWVKTKSGSSSCHRADYFFPFEEEFCYLHCIYVYTGWPKKKKKKKTTTTELINIFITSTKIKQNNSNFVHSNFWTCWWIQWSQFFMHRIYFISWKKEKARIKFMNFSKRYTGSVFFFGGGHPVCIETNPTENVFLFLFSPVYIYIYIYIYIVRKQNPNSLACNFQYEHARNICTWVFLKKSETDKNTS